MVWIQNEVNSCNSQHLAYVPLICVVICYIYCKRKFNFDLGIFMSRSTTMSPIERSAVWSTSQQLCKLWAKLHVIVYARLKTCLRNSGLKLLYHHHPIKIKEYYSPNENASCDSFRTFHEKWLRLLIFMVFCTTGQHKASIKFSSTCRDMAFNNGQQRGHNDGGEKNTAFGGRRKPEKRKYWAERTKSLGFSDHSVLQVARNERSWVGGKSAPVRKIQKEILTWKLILREARGDIPQNNLLCSSARSVTLTNCALFLKDDSAWRTAEPLHQKWFSRRGQLLPLFRLVMGKLNQRPAGIQRNTCTHCEGFQLLFCATTTITPVNSSHGGATSHTVFGTRLLEVILPEII